MLLTPARIDCILSKSNEGTLCRINGTFRDDSSSGDASAGGPSSLMTTVGMAGSPLLSATDESELIGDLEASLSMAEMRMASSDMGPSIDVDCSRTSGSIVSFDKAERFVCTEEVGHVE